jgi:hypothetical protein
VGGGLGPPSVCGGCSWGTGDGGVGGGSSEGELSLAGEGERAKVAGRRTKFDEGGVLGESMCSSDASDEGGVDGRGNEGRMTVQCGTVGQETKE